MAWVQEPTLDPLAPLSTLNHDAARQSGRLGKICRAKGSSGMCLLLIFSLHH